MKTITFLGFSESNQLMIYEILKSLDFKPKVYIFDNQKRFNENNQYFDFNVEFIDNLTNQNNLVFCFLKPKTKSFFINQFNLSSENFVSLIHKESQISPYCSCDYGLRVEPYSYVAPATKIGKFVNINRGCVIGHHNVLEDYVTINPSVSTAGGVQIGKFSEIGINTTILNDVKIGSNTIIGAGSVVTKDIPDNVIAYGNPCKIIKENL